MTLQPLRPVTRLHSAILGHPAATRPAYSKLDVQADAGDVVIRIDPGTARDLAEAWSTAHAIDADLEQIRPRWFDEVVAIHTAAAVADVARGDVPEPVNVPLIRPNGGDQR